MSEQTLRELAKDYAKGTIGINRYRKSRTELVQGIIAGDTVVKAIDYQAPLKPSNEIEDAITEGINREKTQITSPQQTPPKPKNAPPIEQNVTTKKKPFFIFISISAVIVLSLVIVVVLFYPKPPESATSQTANTSKNIINQNNTTTIATNKSVLGESLGESLIADFLNEKNWSEDSLNKFIESWSTLTQKERDSAKQTKRMQRMNDSIYKQFLEGKALASIDSEKAIMKQQRLIGFSSALGLNDSRLILD